MNYIKCACCTLFSLLFTLTVSSGCKEKDMSMKMNEPRNIKGVISYKRSFGDLNDTHLSAAKRIGIRPLASRTEAQGLGGKLVEVAPCERYAMDSLTHSIPFLVPKAGALLDTIGANFLDSLTCNGLNPNQIIVTSVLRTSDDVKRLRRRNGNASANSAHAFGTTFDVSYRRFKKVEDPDGRPMQAVSADTLNLLFLNFLFRFQNAILYISGLRRDKLSWLANPAQRYECAGSVDACAFYFLEKKDRGGGSRTYGCRCACPAYGGAF